MHCTHQACHINNQMAPEQCLYSLLLAQQGLKRKEKKDETNIFMRDYQLSKWRAKIKVGIL